jgi:hypothetical protein
MLHIFRYVSKKRTHSWKVGLILTLSLDTDETSRTSRRALRAFIIADGMSFFFIVVTTIEQSSDSGPTGYKSVRRLSRGRHFSGDTGILSRTVVVTSIFILILHVIMSIFISMLFQLFF